MDEQEIYNRICEPAFRELKKDVKIILTVLKGENGDEIGLCERLRIVEGEHKKVKKAISKGIWILVGVLLLNNAPALCGWLARILTVK
jgi:hypothetical protein